MRIRLSWFWLICISVSFLAGCRADGPRLIIDAENRPVEIRLEMALSDEERAQGLMGRESLADGAGMLFIYGSEHPVMWMKNMLIPLDLVFIGEDLTISHIEHEVPACQLSDDLKCPRYSSNTASIYVLELPAGYTQKKGINEGDQIELLGISGL